MSNTTTTLNPGSGGDVMDESLVTQSDGSTQAKRPRVVIGGDASGSALVDPVNADPGPSPYSIPTLLIALVNDTPNVGLISDQLRPLSLTTDGRLRVTSISAAVYMDFFGDTGPIETDSPAILTSPPNPWKF
jgi:hypothetical protein